MSYQKEYIPKFYSEIASSCYNSLNNAKFPHSAAGAGRPGRAGRTGLDGADLSSGFLLNGNRAARIRIPGNLRLIESTDKRAAGLSEKAGPDPEELSVRGFLCLEDKSMAVITKIRSLAELKKIKEAASAQAKTRAKGKTRVVVKLGTCGLAADARTVVQALTDEVQKYDLDDVVVETEECSSPCQGAPFVDIILNGAPRVTYGRVKPSQAVRIVDEHIVNGQIVRDLVIPLSEE
jgi:NADP-reducing hydrogenase subunit HndB